MSIVLSDPVNRIYHFVSQETLIRIKVIYQSNSCLDTSGWRAGTDGDMGTGTHQFLANTLTLWPIPIRMGTD